MSQAEFNFDAPPKKDASEVSASLLEKIKKLLRLAGSSNPHEAALAMSRAMAMADRANLDLSSLSEDDDVGEIVQRWVPVGKRLSRERQLALGVIQTYFNVHPVMFTRRGEVAFVGTESDIAIAEYVFDFLSRTSRNCLKEFEGAEKWQGRKATAAKRTSFFAGFFYGIVQQLVRQRDEILLEDHKFAVVLRDQEQARQAFVDGELGPTKAVVLRKHRRNSCALESGYRDGRRTSINPGLGSRGVLLALPAS